MPTPQGVQAIVRQRTALVIDRSEAIRLMRLAADGDADRVLQVNGRDWRTGEPSTTRLTVREVLVPPDHATQGSGGP